MRRFFDPRTNCLRPHSRNATSDRARTSARSCFSWTDRKSRDFTDFSRMSYGISMTVSHSAFISCIPTDRILPLCSGSPSIAARHASSPSVGRYGWRWSLQTPLGMPLPGVPLPRDSTSRISSSHGGVNCSMRILLNPALLNVSQLLEPECFSTFPLKNYSGTVPAGTSHRILSSSGGRHSLRPVRSR
jgi:hypothetical protein